MEFSIHSGLFVRLTIENYEKKITLFLNLLLFRLFSNFHLYSISENDSKHFAIGIYIEKIASSVIDAIGNLFSICIKLH